MKKKQIVKIIKQVDYDTLKCLLVATFLLGQETGLKGMIYEHPTAVKYREILIDLLLNPVGNEETQ